MYKCSLTGKCWILEGLMMCVSVTVFTDMFQRVCMKDARVCCVCCMCSLSLSLSLYLCVCVCLFVCVCVCVVCVSNVQTGTGTDKHVS